MAYPVVRFEVMGQDADKLSRFYGDLLGWRFQPGRSPRYRVLEREEGAGGIAGGIGQTGPGHPTWMLFYSEVPDMGAAIATALALGSEVLMAPTQVGDTTLAVVSSEGVRRPGRPAPTVPM